MDTLYWRVVYISDTGYPLEQPVVGTILRPSDVLLHNLEEKVYYFVFYHAQYNESISSTWIQHQSLTWRNKNLKT